jgi:hypothetical protein
MGIERFLETTLRLVDRLESGRPGHVSQDLAATFTQALQISGPALVLIAELDLYIRQLEESWRPFGPFNQLKAVLQVRPAQKFELICTGNSI